MLDFLKSAWSAPGQARPGQATRPGQVKVFGLEYIWLLCTENQIEMNFLIYLKELDKFIPDQRQALK